MGLLTRNSDRQALDRGAHRYFGAWHQIGGHQIGARHQAVAPHRAAALRHRCGFVAALVAACTACGGGGGATKAPSGVFDVDGARAYIHCVGRGHPVVLLESGANNDHRQWAHIQPGAALSTEVCSWDRPGLGKSPTPHETVSADAVVERLHAVLEATRVRPPYVLAGHSLGGFLALLYAHRRSRDVRGLVLIEATPPGVVYPFALGVLADGTHAVDLRADAQELLGVGSAPSGTIVLERGITAFPSSDERLWHLGQVALANGARSLLVTATRSDHGIPEEQPALIDAAIREAVSAVRSGHAPRCTRALARAGGRCRSGR